VRRPLRDGKLEDWDAVEELWARAFAQMRRPGPPRDDGPGHPVLAAYPSDATAVARERYLELLFETFGCEAAYLSRAATLAAFAAGRPSALVVDCGAGSTSVAPVVDGYCAHWAPRAALRGVSGGAASAAAAYAAWPEGFRDFVDRGAARDLKESHCVVPKGYGLAVQVARDKQSFELPDGTVVDPAEPPAVAALPEMIRAALERVDVDVRKDLLLNLLLTGGGSCFAGLPERLHGDVSLALSSPFKVKVVAPSKFERKFGVWIGGSILTSLGSFQQMWLSKREYDDDGPARLVEGRWD
ncbi:hypothetical protein AURANDRAFT_29532, partial [Aureococcus anophagefferens]